MPGIVNTDENVSQFKWLLRRFVEQANLNIQSKEGRSTTVGASGFEKNRFRHTGNFDELEIDNIHYMIHLFNSGSYGPLSGEGDSKLPYLNYDLAVGKSVNIRASFRQQKIETLRIIVHQDQHDTELNEAYQVDDLDLFSKDIPNQKLTHFYATFTNYPVRNGDNDVLGNLEEKLKESKNIILRGAPGTGKSYLAKGIAASLISNGSVQKYADLTLEQKQQVGFVQFHPSYDYTDFVEGLRPVTTDDGEMGFELQNGVFKEFVMNARKAQKGGADNFKLVWEQLILKLEEVGYLNIPNTRSGYFQIELNEQGNGLTTRTYPGEYGVGNWIQGKSRFYNKTQLYNIYQGKPGVEKGGHDNYRKAIVQYMKDNLGLKEYVEVQLTAPKPYVFIIDEINRGEISKIFGELFFSIDPGYRGEEGAVSTQYTNLHDDPMEKFYIPENVYIIGTMNDIDRSVDSFDFAMRRRFRFIEVKANEHIGMLAALRDKQTEATNRMFALNQAIIDVDELNENYQIGAAYFLKLATVSFEQLWSDYLEPLLQDYVRGLYDEVKYMTNFKRAYDNPNKMAGLNNDAEND